MRTSVVSQSPLWVTFVRPGSISWPAIGILGRILGSYFSINSGIDNRLIARAILQGVLRYYLIVGTSKCFQCFFGQHSQVRITDMRVNYSASYVDILLRLAEVTVP